MQRPSAGVAFGQTGGPARRYAAARRVSDDPADDVARAGAVEDQRVIIRGCKTAHQIDDIASDDQAGCGRIERRGLARSRIELETGKAERVAVSPRHIQRARRCGRLRQRAQIDDIARVGREVGHIDRGCGGKLYIVARRAERAAKGDGSIVPRAVVAQAERAAVEADRRGGIAEAVGAVVHLERARAHGRGACVSVAAGEDPQAGVCLCQCRRQGPAQAVGDHTLDGIGVGIGPPQGQRAGGGERAGEIGEIERCVGKDQRTGPVVVEGGSAGITHNGSRAVVADLNLAHRSVAAPGIVQRRRAAGAADTDLRAETRVAAPGVGDGGEIQRALVDGQQTGEGVRPRECPCAVVALGHTGGTGRSVDDDALEVIRPGVGSPKRQEFRPAGILPCRKRSVENKSPAAIVVDRAAAGRGRRQVDVPVDRDRAGGRSCVGQSSPSGRSTSDVDHRSRAESAVGPAGCDGGNGHRALIDRERTCEGAGGVRQSQRTSARFDQSE